MTVEVKPEFRKDQPALRKVGNTVRERLAANPAVWKVPTDKAEVFAVADFMNAEECARMIAMIDEVARPSTVFDLQYKDGYRTSYSGDVDPHHPFIRMLDRRIDDLMGIEPTFGETIQGQRYMPGQEFKPHHDWFHPNTSYWEIETARGGQRAWTAMVYLNDVDEGGTTDFTDLGMAIEPKAGVLLLWNNTDAQGLPNHATIHAGRPVVRGAKYVITKWYRAKPWR
ncbi:2OG-Fe(II) oxygenase [Altererythrobacter sp. KTW20L]|uniref:prolyl hydroxylase family protein n=1 Tax=Altererythrobacter sp. KTW20L TaxID=2942210 RepID=UPI0020BE2117|nr:2OG-Fe(II) oxygenase [Altererythrobacter sp. KTW20L]MCL6249491.1 2OG-Fe(II) oxygenase [Altererythrobacter sp. KTW20L]